MRDLIISIITISVLLFLWLGFDSYSNNELSDMSFKITDKIIPSVESESWEESLEQINDLKDDWHEYKETAYMFLNSDKLDDIDFAILKTVEYIQAEDVSNSSGELSSISEQLRTLSNREKVTFINIF